MLVLDTVVCHEKHASFSLTFLGGVGFLNVKENYIKAQDFFFNV